MLGALYLFEKPAVLTPGHSLFLDSVDEGILVFVQSHVTDYI